METTNKSNTEKIYFVRVDFHYGNAMSMWFRIKQIIRWIKTGETYFIHHNKVILVYIHHIVH